MKNVRHEIKLVLPFLLLIWSFWGASLCPTEAKGQVKVVRDVSYVPNSKSKSQMLDLYIPDNEGKKLPLIVYIHGGGWFSGDKQQWNPGLETDRNYAFASINYRLSKEARFPAQLYDCKAAIRWLRANADRYNIDPDKIGVWGMSAQGHLAALLGTTGGAKALEGDEGNLNQSSQVQAVCDWSGPTNLLSIGKQVGPGNKLELNKPYNIVAQLLGGQPQQKQDVAKLADPCRYVAKGDPPFLIMHGDKDNVVPIEQSEELYKALQQAGVESQFVTVHGGAHGFATGPSYDMALNFFDRTLRKSQQAQN